LRILVQEFSTKIDFRKFLQRKNFLWCDTKPLVVNENKNITLASYQTLFDKAKNEFSTYLNINSESEYFNTRKAELNNRKIQLAKKRNLSVITSIFRNTYYDKRYNVFKKIKAKDYVNMYTLNLDKLYALAVLRELNDFNLLELGKQRIVYRTLENLLESELEASGLSPSDYVNGLYEKEKNESNV